MLEQMDLTKKLSKEAYREKIEELEDTLAALQRSCRNLNIPVILVFEGLDASGKGVQINRLIHPLDPRGFQVFAIKEESEEEKRYPFLRRFWIKTPERGRIAIFDTSWYRRLSVERFEKKVSGKEFSEDCQEIRDFERTLTDDGNVLMKFFLYISREEQRRRFDKMRSSRETAWKVTKADEKRNKSYEKYKAMNEEMLEKTETAYAPWVIVEAEDRRFATVKIYTEVIRRLKEAIAKKKKELCKKQSGKKHQKSCWYLLF